MPCPLVVIAIVPTSTHPYYGRVLSLPKARLPFVMRPLHAPNTSRRRRSSPRCQRFTDVKRERCDDDDGANLLVVDVVFVVVLQILLNPTERRATTIHRQANQEEKISNADKCCLAAPSRG